MSTVAPNPDLILTDLDGEFVTATDPRYAEYVLAWNRTTEHRPAVVISAKSEADVVKAVRYASKQGMPLGVQATGHGMPKNVEDGVLLLMGALKQVTVDPVAKTARIQGGARWKDVFAVTQSYDLSPLSGSSPEVGVVGYTLGGGFSIMSRTYGLAVDRLRSFRLVTPEGEVLSVSANEHPELFWAVRGGGGSFGVITEVEIALVDQPFVYGGQMLFPAERAEEIMSAYVDWAKDAPQVANSSIVFMTFPPIPAVPEPLRGLSAVIVVACICAPEEEATSILAPFRAMEPMIDTCQTIPFSGSAAIYQDPVDPMPFIGQGVVLKSFSEDAIPALLSAFGPFQTSPNLRFEMRHLGGAIREAAGGGTAACKLREADFLVYLAGVPMMTTPDAINAHAAAVFGSLGDHVLCKGPLNFIGEHKVDATALKQLYGEEALARLRKVKATYDAKNHLRYASIGILEAELN